MTDPNKVPFLTPVVWLTSTQTAVKDSKSSTRDYWFTLAEFFLAFSERMGNRPTQALDAKDYSVEMAYRPVINRLNLRLQPKIVATEVAAYGLRIATTILAVQTIGSLAIALQGANTLQIFRIIHLPTQGFSVWLTGITALGISLLVITKIYLRCTRNLVLDNTSDVGSTAKSNSPLDRIEKKSTAVPNLFDQRDSKESALEQVEGSENSSVEKAVTSKIIEQVEGSQNLPDEKAVTSKIIEQVEGSQNSSVEKAVTSKIIEQVETWLDRTQTPSLANSVVWSTVVNLTPSENWEMLNYATEKMANQLEKLSPDHSRLLWVIQWTLNTLFTSPFNGQTKSDYLIGEMGHLFCFNPPIELYRNLCKIENALKNYPAQVKVSSTFATIMKSAEKEEFRRDAAFLLPLYLPLITIDPSDPAGLPFVDLDGLHSFLTSKQAVLALEDDLYLEPLNSTYFQYVDSISKESASSILSVEELPSAQQEQFKRNQETLNKLKKAFIQKIEEKIWENPNVEMMRRIQEKLPPFAQKEFEALSEKAASGWINGRDNPSIMLELSLEQIKFFIPRTQEIPELDQFIKHMVQATESFIKRFILSADNDQLHQIKDFLSKLEDLTRFCIRNQNIPTAAHLCRILPVIMVQIPDLLRERKEK